MPDPSEPSAESITLASQQTVLPSLSLRMRCAAAALARILPLRSQNNTTPIMLLRFVLARLLAFPLMVRFQSGALLGSLRR